MKNSSQKFAKTESDLNDKSKNNTIQSAPFTSSELVCSKCGTPHQDDHTGKTTILYTASCSSKHSFCFKCIFTHFFLNIADIISNSEKNKKELF